MGRLLVRGEPGCAIVDALAPVDGEIVIDKPGKGAFHQTDLEQLLRNRGVDTLLVCGVTTEVCVHTTIREANDRGYRCVALGDACASYFPEFHRIGLEMIKAQGGIRITSYNVCYTKLLRPRQYRGNQARTAMCRSG